MMLYITSTVHVDCAAARAGRGPALGLCCFWLNNTRKQSYCTVIVFMEQKELQIIGKYLLNISRVCSDPNQLA